MSTNSINFNVRKSDWTADSSKVWYCTTTASILDDTVDTCKIRLTSVIYYTSTVSPYNINSPGVLVDFKINNLSAGDKINHAGNAVRSTNDISHISHKMTSWEFSDSGYIKFWDNSKDEFTVQSSTVLINKTTSAQSIAWQATYWPSEDGYLKHDTGFTVSGTINVSAIAHKLTVTYNFNGATTAQYLGSTVTTHEEHYYYNTKVADGLDNTNNSGHLNLTKTGYTTKGSWNTKADGSGNSVLHDTPFATAQLLANALGLNGNDLATKDLAITVYAEWEPNEYTVTYNGNQGLYNGSDAWVDTDKAIYDSTYTVYSNTDFFVRPGYAFTGWVDQYGNACAVGSVTWNRTEDLTLYAQWEAIVYTINYHINKGTIADGYLNPAYATYNEEFSVIPSDKITKEHYKFLGWTANEDGSYDGNNWTDWSGVWDGYYGKEYWEAINSDNTVDLYAMWEPLALMFTKINGCFVPGHPYVKTADGWKKGKAVFIKTPLGWKSSYVNK